MAPHGISLSESFRIHTSTYKNVRSHSIKVDVWVPHNLQPATSSSSTGHPIIFFIHGGNLVTGHRAFEPFINSWLPRFATAYNAVVVSPDYRLLPEATGVELLGDLEDAWQWVFDEQKGLKKVLGEYEPDVRVDVGRILVTGGSAGGFGAVHVSLDHAKQVEALLLQYPMVEMESDWYVKGPGNSAKMMGTIECMPLKDFEEVEKEVEARRRNKVVVTEGGFERLKQISWPGICYGRERRWIGEGNVDPFTRIEENYEREGRHLPERIYLLHGTADSVVPVESSRRFVELLKDRCPDSDVKVDYFEGRDHGCDDDENIVTIWPRPEWAAKTWLA